MAVGAGALAITLNVLPSAAASSSPKDVLLTSLEEKQKWKINQLQHFLIKKYQVRQLSRVFAPHPLDFDVNYVESELEEIIYKDCKKTIRLNQLIINDNPLYQTILCKGVAGSGKTIFCEKLIDEWVRKNLDENIELLFRVKLRNLDHKPSRVCNLSILFEYELANGIHTEDEMHKMKAILSALLSEIGKKIVLILDGFDEIPDSSPWREFILELIEKPITHLIVTARPYSIEEKLFSKVVQLNGVSYENAIAYVKAYFHNEHDAYEIVLNYLKIFSASYSQQFHPILLEVLCVIADTLPKDPNQIKILSMTDLYKEAFWRLIRQFFNRPAIKHHYEQNGITFSSNYQSRVRLEALCKDMLACLEKIAYLSKQTNQLTGDIIRHALDEVYASETADFSVDLLPHLLESGFFTSSNQDIEMTEKNYLFAHEVFKDYLAARYWVNVFTPYDSHKIPRAQAISFLKGIKFNQRHEIFCCFCAGLLARSSDGAQLDGFFSVLLCEPIDIFGNRIALLLIRCLNESNFLSSYFSEVLLLKLVPYIINTLHQVAFHPKQQLLIALSLSQFLLSKIAPRLIKKIEELDTHSYPRKEYILNDLATIMEYQYAAQIKQMIFIMNDKKNKNIFYLPLKKPEVDQKLQIMPKLILISNKTSNASEKIEGIIYLCKHINYLITTDIENFSEYQSVLPFSANSWYEILKISFLQLIDSKQITLTSTPPDVDMAIFFELLVSYITNENPRLRRLSVLFLIKMIDHFSQEQQDKALCLVAEANQTSSTDILEITLWCLEKLEHTNEKEQQKYFSLIMHTLDKITNYQESYDLTKRLELLLKKENPLTIRFIYLQLIVKINKINSRDMAWAISLSNLFVFLQSNNMTIKLFALEVIARSRPLYNKDIIKIIDLAKQLILEKQSPFLELAIDILSSYKCQFSVKNELFFDIINFLSHTMDALEYEEIKERLVSLIEDIISNLDFIKIMSSSSFFEIKEVAINVVKKMTQNAPNIKLNEYAEECITRLFHITADSGSKNTDLFLAVLDSLQKLTAHLTKITIKAIVDFFGLNLANANKKIRTKCLLLITGFPEILSVDQIENIINILSNDDKVLSAFCSIERSPDSLRLIPKESLPLIHQLAWDTLSRYSHLFHDHVPEIIAACRVLGQLMYLGFYESESTPRCFLVADDLNRLVNRWPKNIADVSCTLKGLYNFMHALDGLAVGLSIIKLPAVANVLMRIVFDGWKIANSALRLLSLHDLTPLLHSLFSELHELSNSPLNSRFEFRDTVYIVNILVAMFKNTPLRSILDYFLKNCLHRSDDKSKLIFYVIIEKIYLANGIIFYHQNNFIFEERGNQTMAIRCNQSDTLKLTAFLEEQKANAAVIFHYTDINIPAQFEYIKNISTQYALEPSEDDDSKNASSVYTQNRNMFFVKAKKLTLLGNLPDGRTLKFLEDSVIDEGDKGFTTLEVTREEVKYELIKRQNHPDTLIKMSTEIANALLMDEFQCSIPEILSLLQTYQTKKSQENYQALVEACQKASVFNFYVEESLVKDGWIGPTSALILAQIKDISVYIWQREENASDNQIQFMGCFHGSHFENLYDCRHLLYTGESAHFSLISTPWYYDALLQNSMLQIAPDVSAQVQKINTDVFLFFQDIEQAHQALVKLNESMNHPVGTSTMVGQLEVIFSASKNLPYSIQLTIEQYEVFESSVCKKHDLALT